MSYLDAAEDLFRDMDALKNRKKYLDALNIQSRRNDADEFKIKNFDAVENQRNILLSDRLEKRDLAKAIVKFTLEDIKRYGLDSEGGEIFKNPDFFALRALRSKLVECIKAEGSALYKIEFKAELGERFRQEYQKQTELIIEEKTGTCRTPDEKERITKTLTKQIQDSYPSDAWSALQTKWLIWCDACQGTHVHFLTVHEVTTLLRHSLVKLDTKDKPTFYGLETPLPTFKPHPQEIHLAEIVKGYIQGKLGKQDKE